VRRDGGLWWALAPEGARLDPERYMGELNELPEPAVAGNWCDVTFTDREGTLRWRLVVVEAGRTDSLFTERRTLNGVHEVQRHASAVGTDSPLDARRG
jgi:hypothetical protein